MLQETRDGSRRSPARATEREMQRTNSSILIASAIVRRQWRVCAIFALIVWFSVSPTWRLRFPNTRRRPMC